MADELAEEWPIWRLVLQNAATLTELETTWSIDDVMRANAMLDMRADYEREASTNAGT